MCKQLPRQLLEQWVCSTWDSMNMHCQELLSRCTQSWCDLCWNTLHQCGILANKTWLQLWRGFKRWRWGCVLNWSANYEDLLLQFNLPSLRLRRKLLKLSFSTMVIFTLWAHLLPWTPDWEATILHVSLAWCLVPQPTSHLFFLMLLQCGMNFL